MGNRRVGRKRLYAVEKAGQKIELDSGEGISACISSATQHRQGQEIITEIVMDLGAQATIRGATENFACGLSGKESDITKLTRAKYGVVTEVRAICMEAGSSDIDLILSTTHGASQGATVAGGRSAVIEELDAANSLGRDNSADIDDGTIYSLYIADGDTAGAAGVSSGKLIIYVHGFVIPDDL